MIAATPVIPVAYLYYNDLNGIKKIEIKNKMVVTLDGLKYGGVMIDAVNSEAVGYSLHYQWPDGTFGQIVSYSDNTVGKYNVQIDSIGEKKYTLVLMDQSGLTYPFSFTLIPPDVDNDGVMDGIESEACLLTPSGIEVMDNGCLVGDVNGDGKVNSFDVALIKKNSEELWDYVDGDLKKLNGFLQKMVGNWG